MGSIGDPNVFVLIAFFGGAIASWVMMRFEWLPDPPPPDVRGRYLTVLILGTVGGVVGGYFGLAGSNHMPLIAALGAGAGGLVAAGSVAILGSAKGGGTGR